MSSLSLATTDATQAVGLRERRDVAVQRMVGAVALVQAMRRDGRLPDGVADMETGARPVVLRRVRRGEGDERRVVRARREGVASVANTTGGCAAAT